jgi:hypothetical protein
MRAAVSAPSGLASDGIATIVVMESCHLMTAVVATTSVVVVRSPIQRDRPALE